jgi:hypothetical protein
MPRIYQTKLWRLQLPDSWKVEGAGEHAMMFRPDGVGQLQVHGFDTVGRLDVLAYARDHSPPGTALTETRCGRLRGFAGVRVDGDILWRTWWLLCREQLVYVAYQCAEKNRLEESDEIGQILRSFDESDASDGGLTSRGTE